VVNDVITLMFAFVQMELSFWMMGSAHSIEVLGLGGRSACDELTYTKWIVELIISLILLLHRSITVSSCYYAFDYSIWVSVD